MSETATPADQDTPEARHAEPAYLRQALHAQVGEFIRLRREIHSEPELAFEEHRTAALVAEKLAAWGYSVECGIGGTGVVGRLSRGAGTRRLGLRADMDALPITEATGAAWASRRPGLMHACGHDGHTAMLLAAARRLAEEGDFSGTLQLIFQPAEEGGGGALRMIEDGLFERYPCDAVFAMHNMPGVTQGHLVFREGAAMASSDYASITLTGVGGHGGMPHRAVDPVVAASSIVMALQTIVARNVDPQAMAVIVFSGLPLLTAQRGHLSIDLFDAWLLRPGWRHWHKAVDILIGAVLGLIAWQYAIAVGEAHANNEVSQALSIPRAWMYAFMSFTSAVAAVSALFVEPPQHHAHTEEFES